MKEFDTLNSDKEVKFNNMLSSYRNQVKCAFLRLKAKLAILKEKKDKIRNTANCHISLFCLHN